MSPTTYWLPTCYLVYVMTSYSVGSYSPKKVVYMDTESTCNRILTDDGLSEGESYEIKSDKKIEGGLSKWSDRQYIALCPVGINFGDRLIAIVIERWWCEKSDSDAYLAIYSDCFGRRNGLLKWFNSSNVYPLSPVYSPRSCVTLIFYRGVQTNKDGCHFEMSVVARYEIFPAFKISAVIISSIVLLMILVKIGCVVSGYERRLPNVNVNIDEHKFILSEHSSTDNAVIQVQHPSETESSVDNVAHHSSDTLSADPGRENSHLSVSGARQPAVSGSTSSAFQFDGDYFDLPSEPRLKRYPSCKTPSIWSH